MILKLHEIIALHFELNGYDKSKGLKSQLMSQKLKIILHRIGKVTEEEVKSYESLKQELFKKYGKEDGDKIVIEPNNKKDFNIEHNEMLEVEKEIDTKQFWGESDMVALFESVESEEYYPTFYKLIGI